MIHYQRENFGKSHEYRRGLHLNWSVPAHIHEFSELAFTKSGCQTVYVDGEKYLVPENHAIFILPNQIHEYTDEKSASMLCAVFSNDFIQLFFQRLSGCRLINPVADFSDCLSLISALGSTSAGDTVRLSGLLGLICDRFLKSSAITSKAPARGAVYRDVIDYVSENYKTDITLKEISEKLGYNEKYLSSSLHALTNMNFRTFLASYRIEFAKQCLLSGKEPITDIALECGFSSINTFNRVFKQLTGMTPREYRQKRNPFG